MTEHFPNDPTAQEVQQELRTARERAERIAERKRRQEWDQEHGALTDDTIEGEAEEVPEELSSGE